MVLFVGGLALTVWSEGSASAGDGRRLGCRPTRTTSKARSSASARTSPPCGPSLRPRPVTDRQLDARRVPPGRTVAPMFNMAIGEVVFGGVGSGLYGMIFYVIRRFHRRPDGRQNA